MFGYTIIALLIETNVFIQEFGSTFFFFKQSVKKIVISTRLLPCKFITVITEKVEKSNEHKEWLCFIFNLPVKYQVIS